MRAAAVLLAACGLLLVQARPAQAVVDDYVGRPLAEVHVRSSEIELRDPALLEIIETKVGEPLVIANVRETIAHLFGLARYQDVQVDATLSGANVVLT